VKHYLSGLEGQKATAKRFGIDHSAVRKWSSAWKLHGEAGLSTRHFRYPPAFKEAVILYMRDHLLSARQVSAKFNIPAFTPVCQWERLYDEGGLEALKDNRRGRKRVSEPAGKKAAKNVSTLLNSDEREEPEQLCVEVAYLKKLQALLRGKSTPGRGTKRRS
jgi:transposase